MVILEVFLNPIPNIIYKYNKFSKVLSKKNFELVSVKEVGCILFISCFMLLLLKIDTILKKQDYKKNMFIACGTSFFKIIFAFLAEVIIFYIQVFILEFGISSFE